MSDIIVSILANVDGASITADIESAVNRANTKLDLKLDLPKDLEGRLAAIIARGTAKGFSSASAEMLASIKSIESALAGGSAKLGQNIKRDVAEAIKILDQSQQKARGTIRSVGPGPQGSRSSGVRTTVASPDGSYTPPLVQTKAEAQRIKILEAEYRAASNELKALEAADAKNTAARAKAEALRIKQQEEEYKATSNKLKLLQASDLAQVKAQQAADLARAKANQQLVNQVSKASKTPAGIGGVGVTQPGRGQVAGAIGRDFVSQFVNFQATSPVAQAAVNTLPTFGALAKGGPEGVAALQGLGFASATSVSAPLQAIAKFAPFGIAAAAGVVELGQAYVTAADRGEKYTRHVNQLRRELGLTASSAGTIKTLLKSAGQEDNIFATITLGQIQANIQNLKEYQNGLRELDSKLEPFEKGTRKFGLDIEIQQGSIKTIDDFLVRTAEKLDNIKGAEYSQAIQELAGFFGQDTAKIIGFGSANLRSIINSSPIQPEGLSEGAQKFEIAQIRAANAYDQLALVAANASIGLRTNFEDFKSALTLRLASGLNFLSGGDEDLSRSLSSQARLNELGLQLGGQDRANALASLPDDRLREKLYADAVSRLGAPDNKYEKQGRERAAAAEFDKVKEFRAQRFAVEQYRQSIRALEEDAAKSTVLGEGLVGLLSGQGYGDAAKNALDLIQKKTESYLVTRDKVTAAEANYDQKLAERNFNVVKNFNAEIDSIQRAGKGYDDYFERIGKTYAKTEELKKKASQVRVSVGYGPGGTQSLDKLADTLFRLKQTGERIAADNAYDAEIVTKGPKGAKVTGERNQFNSSKSEVGDRLRQEKFEYDLAKLGLKPGDDLSLKNIKKTVKRSSGLSRQQKAQLEELLDQLEAEELEFNQGSFDVIQSGIQRLTPAIAQAIQKQGGGPEEFDQAFSQGPVKILQNTFGELGLDRSTGLDLAVGEAGLLKQAEERIGSGEDYNKVVTEYKDKVIKLRNLFTGKENIGLATGKRDLTADEAEKLGLLPPKPDFKTAGANYQKELTEYYALREKVNKGEVKYSDLVLDSLDIDQGKAFGAAFGSATAGKDEGLEKAKKDLEQYRADAKAALDELKKTSEDFKIGLNIDYEALPEQVAELEKFAGLVQEALSTGEFGKLQEYVINVKAKVNVKGEIGTVDMPEMAPLPPGSVATVAPPPPPARPLPGIEYPKPSFGFEQPASSAPQKFTAPDGTSLPGLQPIPADPAKSSDPSEVEAAVLDRQFQALEKVTAALEGDKGYKPYKDSGGNIRDYLDTKPKLPKGVTQQEVSDALEIFNKQNPRKPLFQQPGQGETSSSGYGYGYVPPKGGLPQILLPETGGGEDEQQPIPASAPTTEIIGGDVYEKTVDPKTGRPNYKLVSIRPKYTAPYEPPAAPPPLPPPGKPITLPAYYSPDGSYTSPPVTERPPSRAQKDDVLPPVAPAPVSLPVVYAAPKDPPPAPPKEVEQAVNLDTSAATASVSALKDALSQAAAGPYSATVSVTATGIEGIAASIASLSRSVTVTVNQVGGSTVTPNASGSPSDRDERPRVTSTSPVPFAIGGMLPPLNIKRFAFGGPIGGGNVSIGGLSLVGEYGPELIASDARNRSRVIPSSITNKFVNGLSEYAKDRNSSTSVSNVNWSPINTLQVDARGIQNPATVRREIEKIDFSSLFRSRRPDRAELSRLRAIGAA